MMEQQTAEWYAARVGKFTSSRMTDLKSDRYRWQLALERLTGRSHEPQYQSREMQWGNEHEADAADLYSFLTDRGLEKVGFIDHPTMPRCGASPDRLVVGEKGMVEIKCPASHTHGAYLLGAPIDRGYVLQMQWQMEVAKRDWCDWVSYDPRFEGGDIPPGSEIIIRRVERDAALIRTLRSDVRKADKAVQDLVLQVSQRGEAA
jgi:putative phage-type endonuclease